MKPRIILLLIVQGIISSTLLAQNYMKIGTQAPAFKVGKWLKGEEVSSFKKDHIYIVEFWATWCKPCIANMPHLTEIAKKYKDKNVHVIGVDASDGNMSSDSLQAFVDRMGDKMNYSVVIDNKERFMGLNWLKLAGSEGIPKSFLVDQKGNIAWIGHPALLGPILNKVLAEDINYQEIDKTIERDAPKPKWDYYPESNKITENAQEMQKLIDQKAFEKAFKIYADMEKSDAYTASGLTTQALKALLYIDYKRALIFLKKLIADDAPQLLYTIYFGITYSSENLDLPREFYEISKNTLLKCVKQQSYLHRQPFYLLSLSEAYFRLNEQKMATEVLSNNILDQLMMGGTSDYLEYVERRLQKYKYDQNQIFAINDKQEIPIVKKAIYQKKRPTTLDKLDLILTSNRMNAIHLLDSLKSTNQKIDYYNAYKFTLLLGKEENKATEFVTNLQLIPNFYFNSREIVLMCLALKNKLKVGSIQDSTSKFGLRLCSDGLKRLDKAYSFFFYDLQAKLYANNKNYSASIKANQSSLECLDKIDYSQALMGCPNCIEVLKKECKVAIEEYRRKLE